jgi:hypothetical protein
VQLVVGEGRPGDVTAQARQPVAIIGPAARRRMQAEAGDLDAGRLARAATRGAEAAADRRDAAAGMRAGGDAIGRRGQVKRRQCRWRSLRHVPVVLPVLRIGEPGAASIEDEALAVDAAKALAAFQETLVSARTAFDEFRDALTRGDRATAARYPLAAQCGARLFVGKGNCAFCHLGPGFTNGEFHDIGIPFFVDGGVDGGRHDGIKRLRDSALSLLGRWNDDPARAPGLATRHVEPQHRNFGEFHVPGLRGVAATAPYMHNGSLATLRDVVRHYSELNEDRLHADGEAILKPLKLDAGEIDDLVAFLESLGPSAASTIDTEPGCRATNG